MKLTLAEVMGGLGNQMFIYAAARAAQLEAGGRCVLVYRDDDSLPHTKLGLDALCLSPQVELLRERDGLKRLAPVQNAVRSAALRWEARHGMMARDWSGFERRLAPLLNRFGVHLATEGYLPWHRPAFPATFLLWGYFQSEGYFAPYKNTILRELSPRETPQGPFTAALLEARAAGPLVCVHVRRGDYLRPENAALQVCTPAYYRRALAKASEELPGARFAFFSDDPAWVKEALGSFAPQALFAPAGGSAAGDLALMRLATAYILSNSTYSWWAAMLSEAAAPLVIAPERWYSGGKQTALYRPSWALVPTQEETA